MNTSMQEPRSKQVAAAVTPTEKWLVSLYIQEHPEAGNESELVRKLLADVFAEGRRIALARLQDAEAIPA